ncbi:iron-containing alcohol dehydrogenase family protein [Paenibacillus sp. 7124]|uniref:Iron-containing alcohol dehydrogenase family protein n=1 Tax=Paenibacillus apii TaxID=1850370 RepID=A0A6M1PKI2_9BACL|nr:iron-containing alcohol dehydrogenase family protein [Paenibacillus apii]NGM83909.1 iron-containing alcohol dehydrogenase family protein [Paenibacillus apii]
MKRQAHEVSIPALLEVGDQVLSHFGELLGKAGFSRIVLCFGEGIRPLCEPQIVQSLTEQTQLEILDNRDVLDNSLEVIASTAFTLPARTEAIVGIGGGKGLDIAKYMAFLNGLPFISVPTSVAHDGFASSGCSLYVDGRRTSVPARMPYGILVDLGLVRNSPIQFLYSGLGDILSKIPAVFDWRFEESRGATRVNDFAVMMAKKSVNSIVRMPYTDIREFFFIKEIVDSLTLSGIAMEIAGSSAPASGSEHLISHALDQLVERPQLHGIQVGVASYLMCLVQEHRVERVRKFLGETGFFDFVATLGMKREDFERAIDLAPSIKPSRRTYLHLPEMREKAKQLLHSDETLGRILS